MSNLRRYLFLVAFYLLFILVLGQLDRADTPIINFASYFYLSAIFIVPVMIFVPSLHKVPVYVPMIFWGAIYFALLRIIDRSLTASTDVEVVMLEFVLLEVGVWFSYQLAVAIERSESLMDVLAQGTFPNRAVKLEDSYEVVKVELGRSRRYHRPLSLIFVNAVPKSKEAANDLLQSLQRDMLSRLSTARTGHAISDCIRQTDILIRDNFGRYMILCPETGPENVQFLSKRIIETVELQTGLAVQCGASSFPDEALNFEDLIRVARDRSKEMQLSLSNTETIVESSAEKVMK